MAEETTTVTPKQMGSHLRAVRRRKGLSLSEVARGAGLNRRELVNYERGKATIPESDLWVLAGSIGVDVTELVPPAPRTDVPPPSDNVPALRTDNSTGSIGDAVAMLRRSTEVHEASPRIGVLRMLQQLPEGKRVPVKDRELAAIAADLGSNPAEIEVSIATILGCDNQEAARVRAILMTAPQHGRRGRKAKATAAAEVEPAARYQAPVVPPPPPSEPVPTEHAAVDVFEELARLPEPLPLPEETNLPDIISTPPAPEGAVELVDHDTFPSLGERFGFKQPAMAESTATAASATAAAAASSALHSGADAPPIDVAMRTDDWAFSGPAADEPLARRMPPDVPTGPWATEPAPGVTGTNGNGWAPPVPTDGSAPNAFWEGTDDWAPTEPPQSNGNGAVEGDAVAEAIDAAAPSDPNSLWSFEPAAVDPWIAGGWPESGTADAPATAELVDSEWPPAAFTPVEDMTAHPADIWGVADARAEGPAPFGFAAAETDADVETPAAPTWATTDDSTGHWDHSLDPAAVDSGFVVDWGEADDAEPDEPAAGQWASSGTWDEPLTPVWEVQTADPFAAAVETDEATQATEAPGAQAAFDVYDAFAADPFAAATEDSVAGTIEGTTGGADDHSFTFGSDLAAALAATYEPDGTEEAEAEAFVAETVEVETLAAAESRTPEAGTFETAATWTPEPEPEPEPETEMAVAAPIDELPRIVWRADAAGNVDAVDSFGTATEPEPEPEPEPEVFTEVFVNAGRDWQLGNAVPLVEVGNAGALVMRRADERWALADVTTAPDFVLEVDVDFRSGPGLGVLFRASVDNEGRMSGYSFDIDPIYDGGGFLVRQWLEDRELWNPIARVAAEDPNTMYGKLTVRLEVHGETLTASVNGTAVMTVHDLAQASVERDREAARGDRVGVQAWSSSDLVIDTLRVAAL